MENSSNIITIASLASFIGVALIRYIFKNCNNVRFSLKTKILNITAKIGVTSQTPSEEEIEVKKPRISRARSLGSF